MQQSKPYEPMTIAEWQGQASRGRPKKPRTMFYSRASKHAKMTVLEVTDQRTARKKKIALRSRVPKGCSQPRLICRICQQNVVRPNSNGFLLKQCRECMSREVKR